MFSYEPSICNQEFNGRGKGEFEELPFPFGVRRTLAGEPSNSFDLALLRAVRKTEGRRASVRSDDVVA